MEYDLSKFIQNQEKKTGVLNFGEVKIRIKEDAYTFIRLQNSFIKHKENPEELFKSILSITLSADDKKLLEELNLSPVGMEKVVITIVSHIMGHDPKKYEEMIIEEGQKVPVGK